MFIRMVYGCKSKHFANREKGNDFLLTHINVCAATFIETGMFQLGKLEKIHK